MQNMIKIIRYLSLSMVDSTNQVHAFHEPPSLRPNSSSAQQWVTPELGLSSTPKVGNPRLGWGYKEYTQSQGMNSLPGTTHAHCPRLSFPTCLFHPRSIHLLCHLDSPLATNLPCLGLQQQTGPEVSEICCSYRVPSRSSLLPLRTLSPGERVDHRSRNLFFQLQSPLSLGESVVQTGQQATRSLALHGHNSQWGKQTRAFQQA